MNLHLYDASAYIHRFFHACPDMRRQSDNEPVGALAGFCSMMMDEIERAPARGVTHMAMVYDTGKATFRNKMYPAYKANRKPKPEALQSQIRLMRDAVDAFGIASTDCDGYEADDVIATWTRIAVEAGGTVTIHSSDKDLMQLVSRSVTQRCPVKGREYCGIDVLEKFGVHPHQLGDVLALMGDTADNIPGIAGIGPKTAARLLLELEGKTVTATGEPGGPPPPPSPADDVVNALLALGYNDKEAAAACKDLPADQALNESIRQALKLLSKAK